MERSNYNGESGRGAGGDRRGGGSSRGRGARDPHDHHRQRYDQQQSYQRGGPGGWRRGPAYQPPVPQWSPRPFQPRGGSYRPHPRPPADQGRVATRPETGESSAVSYGGGGRGAWGSYARGLHPVSSSFPAPGQSHSATDPRPDAIRGAAKLELGESSARGSYGGGGRDSSILDMQSLTISEQPPSSSLLGDKRSNLLPVRRPDTGGTEAIRHLKVIVNHFVVTFNPKNVMMHYDIDIKPEVPSKSLAKMSKSNLRMIKDKLFSDDPSRFPYSVAYDGEKSLVSAVPLPTGKFKVEFSGGEEGKGRSFMVTIRETSKLEFSKLNDYLKGEMTSLPRDILQGMDLVMRENPARNRISIGRSFFPSVYCDDDDLVGGITTAKGFQQSLKPTAQGLALCLDYSVLPFRKPLPVIDFLMQHVRGFRGVNDVTRLKKEVVKALKGLKVRVTHRITKQKFTVAGLTDEKTDDLSFNAEDPQGKVPPTQVELVQYFREKYGKEIAYKDIPCLNLGKNRKNYVPMEFCILVEGQRYPKEQLSKEASKRLKNMSLAWPKVRMEAICDMVRAEDGPCRGDIAREFGMEVIEDVTEVNGRVIRPPPLKVGAPSGDTNVVAVDKDKCDWNFVGKSSMRGKPVRRWVVEGKPVERWVLVDFSSSKLIPDRFIPSLRNRCRNLGIPMDDPLVFLPTDTRPFYDISNLRSLLESVVDKAHVVSQGRLQLIVCAMAEKDDDGYKSIKWLSETQIGIVTQCCLSSHANEAKDQYLANLALKINAKLGGSNFELIERLPNFEGNGHVMFIGADVNHPAPGNSTCPSMAAVVATLNWPAANHYAARVCPQKHRAEKMMNFGGMCLELIQSYARVNKVKPERIVVFRDGVSESEFDMVLNEELLDLKTTIYEEHYQPTITVIVAQKRHQTRMLPKNPRDEGFTGNVPPGTVVDTVVTNLYEFDFYLCSHYGSLGTSRPTHYYCLWNEHNFTSDQLQKLVYHLCFTFARCTKPVSLAPPVCYADFVAERGRMYHDVVTANSPPGSAVSSSSSITSTSLPNASFADCFKLHPELEDVMFFV